MKSPDEPVDPPNEPETDGVRTIKRWVEAFHAWAEGEGPFPADLPPDDR